MGLDLELIEMMNDVLAIELVAKDSNGVPLKDKFGKMSYETPRGERCYISRMNKIARNRNGEEVTSTLQAIMADPSLPVTGDDLITLSDGSHPAVIEIRAGKDELGADYYLEIMA